jgi:hypothetical protein
MYSYFEVQPNKAPSWEYKPTSGAKISFVCLSVPSLSPVYDNLIRYNRTLSLLLFRLTQNIEDQI